MMLIPEFEPAFAELNSLLKSDFGTTAQFISPISKSPQDTVFFETVRRNSGAPFILTHSHMLFPVRLEGRLIGALRIPNIHTLTHQEISEVKDLVDAKLEETAKTLSQNQLSVILELESNVLPMRKYFDEKLASAN